MSDIPTKTYPPAFLKAIIDEAAAEATTPEDASGIQQGDTMSDKIEEIKQRHCQLGDSGLQRLIDRAYLLGEVERLKTQGSQASDELHEARCIIIRMSTERDEALAEIEQLRQEERQTADRERELARGTIDRLAIERDFAQREVERLKAEVYQLANERNEALDEAKRLTSERDEAQAEVERLTAELTENEGVLAVWRRRTIEAEAEAERLRADIARLTTERDTALSNVKWLIDKGHERERNRQASLNGSRPSDEDIWREAFVSMLHHNTVAYTVATADAALAEYRQRWPR